MLMLRIYFTLIFLEEQNTTAIMWDGQVLAAARSKLAPCMWVCSHLAPPHALSEEPDGVSTSSVGQAEFDP